MSDIDEIYPDRASYCKHVNERDENTSLSDEEIKILYRDPLHIPPVSIQEGFEYHWIRTAIWGELDNERINEAKEMGFVPVKDEEGNHNTHKGSILCRRPYVKTKDFPEWFSIIRSDNLNGVVTNDQNYIFKLIKEKKLSERIDFKSICTEKFEGWKSAEIFYDEEKGGLVITGVKDLPKPLPKNVDEHPKEEGWREVKIWYKFSKEELAIIEQFEKLYMKEPNYMARYVQEKIKQLEIYKDIINEMKEDHYGNISNI